MEKFILYLIVKGKLSRSQSKHKGRIKRIIKNNPQIVSEFLNRKKAYC